MTITTNSVTDAEALAAFIDRFSLGIRTSMPCTVEAVGQDGGFWYVDVVPSISQIVTLDGQQSVQPLPKLARVPVGLPYAQGLGLSITLPIQPGDEGWLHIADRSIDNWQYGQGGTARPLEPTVTRHHDLTDAYFVPGAIRQATAIQQLAVNAIEIRNEDASTAVAVGEDFVEMRETAGATLTLQGNTITLSASSIVLEGAITHDGQVTGTAGATYTDDVVAAGISVSTHTHNETGTVTEPPNP